MLAASLGTSLLFKSLVGVVFPVAAALVYLAHHAAVVRARDLEGACIRVSGLLVVLAIAAPWHILATLRNPPYFDFTMRSAPGEYHGFLWFYFINEQLLRFLNMRYPRDYDTVPRLYFWLFHLLWLFPWSVYFPAVVEARLSSRVDRAGKTRLLALCWTGFILVFFTFSTTQEYYSMPCYPALALLLGSAMAAGGNWVRYGTRVLCGISCCAGGGGARRCISCRGIFPRRAISRTALSSHPGAYKLSLGHMEDLTIASFAYLRLPLLIAALAFLVGAAGTFARHGTARVSGRGPDGGAVLPCGAHGAWWSSIRISRRGRWRKLCCTRPQGKLIVDHHYYTFSSIFFYTDRDALLLNGRFNNLVYGSYAPGAPNVFIDDAQWKNAVAASRTATIW